MLQLTLGGLAVWMLVLITQNASFTMVSRARNSGSDWYHAIASVFSNGIWFVAFYLTWGYLDFLHELSPFGSPREFALTALILVCYIIPTVTGSVYMGKFLRRFVEKGKRQVGHYDEKAARIESLESEVRLLARVLNNHLGSEKERAAKDTLRVKLQAMREAEGANQEADDVQKD